MMRYAKDDGGRILMEQWVEENCQCGLSENGEWSEDLIEEFGCTCREENDDDTNDI